MCYVPDLLNPFGFLLLLLLFSFPCLSFDALVPLVRIKIKASNSRRRISSDSEIGLVKSRVMLPLLNHSGFCKAMITESLTPCTVEFLSEIS